MDNEKLVSAANKFLGDEKKPELTQEQIDTMALAIRQNTNFNHDATQPYTPAEEFEFHKVVYIDRKGNTKSKSIPGYWSAPSRCALHPDHQD